MPDITFEKDELVEFLVEYLELEQLKEKITHLKDIDWNPFDEDGDEYEGAWAEIRHNYDIVWDAVLALVNTAEKIVIGAVGLTSQQKHDAVVSALDRAIRAPWYLEPFDGPALGMLVSAAVSFMNRVNWGVGEEALEALQLQLSTTGKLQEVI